MTSLFKNSLADLAAEGTTPVTDQGAEPSSVGHASLPFRGTVRKNKFAGKCWRCGVRIEAEQGRLIKDSTGWVVEHVDACPEPVVMERLDPPKADAQVRGEAIPDGTYTVVFPEGDYKTLRVRTQAEDASFKPGQQIVSYLSGSNNDADFTSFGNFTGPTTVKVWQKHLGNKRLTDAVKVLVHDPRAAAAAYGLESQKCGMCGRTLTTKDSLERGIGPKCAADAGWE